MFRRASRCRESRSASSDVLQPVDVAKSLRREWLAHTIDVETQFAGCKSSAFIGFARLARPGLLQYPHSRGPRNDDDAIVVGDDQIARVHDRPAADDRDVDIRQRFLDRSLRADRFGPHRETRFGEACDITNAGFDHKPADAARPERLRQQIAEVAVDAGTGRSHYQGFGLLALLDGDVDHPVVPGCNLTGYRTACDVSRPEDRPEMRSHQALTILGFVYRRDADAFEA